MFFTVASVCLTMCVCIDLILTIKRPFKAKEPRMPRYYIFTFVISTLQATTLTFFYMNEVVLTIAEWVGTGTVLLLWLLSIGSIVYGLVKLCQPGISREVRNVIMARHVVTILFFVIGNLYLQAGTVVLFMSTTGSSSGQKVVPDNDSTWVRVLKIIYGLQGLFLPLTRLSEPFFFNIVKLKIKKISCCSKSNYDTKIEYANDSFLKRGIKASDLEDRASLISDGSEISDRASTISTLEREEPIEMAPLFLLLSSSLNVELVYIILKSIT